MFEGQVTPVAWLGTTQISDAGPLPCVLTTNRAKGRGRVRGRLDKGNNQNRLGIMNVSNRKQLMVDVFDIIAFALSIKF